MTKDSSPFIQLRSSVSLHLLLLILLSWSQYTNGQYFSIFSMRRRNFCLEYSSNRPNSQIHCGAWCSRKMKNVDCSAFLFTGDVEPRKCECWTAFCDDPTVPDNDDTLTLHRNTKCLAGELQYIYIYI